MTLSRIVGDEWKELYTPVFSVLPPEAVTLTLIIFGEDELFSMPRAKEPPSAVAITSLIVGEDPALFTPTL